MVDTSLLKLPNELLIKICHQSDVADLLALSVTCRRLNDVAQEVLIGTATFSVKNILKLIETLRSKPGLCKALTHVRLGALNFEYISDVCPRMKPGTWEDAYDALYASYEKSTTPFNMNVILPTEARLSAQLGKLFALSAGLKAISTGCLSVEVIPLLSSCLNGTVLKYPRRMLDWYEQVRIELQSHLELLEVVPEHLLPNHEPNSGGHLWPYTYINLAHFDRLKQLTVPFTMISQRPVMLPGSKSSHVEHTDPLQVLPRSLEFIRLITDGILVVRRFSIPDLDWVDRLITANPVLTKLYQVELQFEFNILCTTGMFRGPLGADEVANAFLAKLGTWKKGSVAVATTFKYDLSMSEDPESDKPTYEYRQGDFVTALENALRGPSS